LVARAGARRVLATARRARSRRSRRDLDSLEVCASPSATSPIISSVTLVLKYMMVAFITCRIESCRVLPTPLSQIIRRSIRATKLIELLRGQSCSSLCMQGSFREGRFFSRICISLIFRGGNSDEPVGRGYCNSCCIDAGRRESGSEFYRRGAQFSRTVAARGCLKIAGGIYLVYLASKIWRGATTPLSLDGMQPGYADNGRKAFWTGLGTQMSNPKTAIVYGSIFAALLPQNPPLWCYIALPPLVFAVEAGWYTVVALCFSSERPRALYMRWKTWVDRLAAGAIAGLGLRLIFNAHNSGV